MTSRPATELRVEAIYDLRENPLAPPVHADSYLAALSEAEWTDLREKATRSGRTENPLLQCGDCRKAVYGRESIRGRRHCYHFRGDHSGCRWSGATGRSQRAVDAEKFHGQQVSEAHETLAALVAEVLALDPAAREAGITFRRYTRLPDGEYGYPDVFAETWQSRPAAFEIQLSTTPMSAIFRREDLYERGSIRLVWIVGFHGKSLNRRAFRDIYMRNDGQILGMDGEVAAEARLAGAPRFRLYRWLPGPAREGFSPRLQNRIAAVEDMNWDAPGGRPRSAAPGYDAYLNERVERHTTLAAYRREFYEALGTADTTDAGRIWDAAAGIVGGLPWAALEPQHGTARALGVLATLRTGRLCVPTRIDPSNLPHLVNSMLLEPEDRWRWTHAFELLCRAIGLDDLLEWPKVKEKRIRNREAQRSATPIDVAAGAVFDVFFPEGAFWRINFEL